ncbi:calcium channel flower isoform X1 [Sitodiplosis mosellana]|uniref:calcium channel flower isoform X1 n=1 Tax=Sitodiplosis mosellana TaxID=263140 RepID=UPI002444A240|nr:calcium channel flower isoform X1 [Sitodiplosis mosellana]
MEGFAQKMTGLVAGPTDAAQSDIPWYLRYGARGLGIFGAFFAILFGFWNCFGVLTINFSSVLSGILQILVGILVMSIEAPVCCMFIDYAQKFAQTVESRPQWWRAAGYCAAAIPPVLLEPGLASIFGCGLIFATGVLYGMMSLGKKATLEQMRQAAAATSSDNRNGTMRPGNNLVNNAQPLSFTPPPYDSNV